MLEESPGTSVRPPLPARVNILIVLLLLACVPINAQATCVILLHGLARTDSSMDTLATELQKNSFTVVNVNYPSREQPIEVLAEHAIGPAVTQCPEDDQINFVTHSMGGILVRQYLSEHDISRLNRVVMLGPPNKGSEVVDKLMAFPGFYFLNGDAGLQLGTGELSVPNKLGKANFDVGIIAGVRSINWILSGLIPGKDDGKVSVERTRLEGMNDHIELPVTHPFMMSNRYVIAQVIYYLQHGHFERNKR